MRLEARGITVTAETRRIVDAASLGVSSGELVGLVGPNGAGKSTLFKAMLGLRRRSDGGVRLDGDDFDALSLRERGRRVAFLPQERQVEWRLPVRDVVMLGRYPHQRAFGRATQDDHDAVARALEAVDGEGLTDRPIAVLSGGERSRILLARALAVESPILLVDEPVTALDPYHQLHVMEILRSRARGGAGVLAIIHDLALAARFMDRVVLMDKGRVVGEGPPQEVLSPERLERVYRIRALDGAQDGERWILPWTRADEATHRN
ncbi:MAG: ABC transporter ATP-binding protein [Alphaproteobacteria bacterium]|nr:ABC transporter ATP-binding protein [Alphaproteobacteria bacterium]